MGKKGKISWVGSKCHIVETAERGKVNFITDMIYQKAHESDIKIHDKIKTSSIKKLFCDTNYMSGEKIKEFEDNDKKLMGYAKTENSPKPKGFKVADFKIDMKNKKAICPAKKNPKSFSQYKNGSIEIRFSRTICKICKYYELCVGENKEKVRILKLTEHHEYLQKRRKEQKTDRFMNQMRVRAQVEGTISEAVRFHGLRFKKYKGVLGDKLQFYLTGAAINIKRLKKAINKT